jgi:hypothetical protein
MVDVHLEGGRLRLAVRGWHKLWSFKSTLEVPLSAVRGVRADPEVGRGLWKGFRAPGTYIPRVIVAGTFYRDGQKHFWDVQDSRRAIVIDLDGQRYDRLIVEVVDPEGEVRRISDAMGAAE